MTETAAPPQVATRKRPAPWPIDILNGAFRGDYCPNLGYSGYITQGVLGFVPVIGSICAFRDLMAAMGKNDGLGMVLNGFSLIPGFGGFPKTAHVIRGAKSLSQVYGTSKNMTERWADQHSDAPPPVQA